MISLIFDTETTGMVLWKEGHEHPDQPGLVELAFELYNHERGEPMTYFSSVINPGMPVTEGASNVHGLTDEVIKKVGIPAKPALFFLIAALNIADRVVAHNLSFDKKVIHAALHQCGLNNTRLDSLPGHCTMHASTPILKLPSQRTGFKWPKLDEAYRFLVDPDGFEGAHRAYVDVVACRKVMLALESYGEEGDG